MLSKHKQKLITITSALSFGLLFSACYNTVPETKRLTSDFYFSTVTNLELKDVTEELEKVPVRGHIRFSPDTIYLQALSIKGYNQIHTPIQRVTYKQNKDNLTYHTADGMFHLRTRGDSVLHVTLQGVDVFGESN